MPERWKRREAAWQFLRGVVLFFAGLAGVAVETISYLTGGRVEPTLIILFAAMMGLPFVLTGPTVQQRGNPNGNGNTKNKNLEDRWSHLE